MLWLRIRVKKKEAKSKEIQRHGRFIYSYSVDGVGVSHSWKVWRGPGRCLSCERTYFRSVASKTEHTLLVDTVAPHTFAFLFANLSFFFRQLIINHLKRGSRYSRNRVYSKYTSNDIFLLFSFSNKFLLTNVIIYIGRRSFDTIYLFSDKMTQQANTNWFRNALSHRIQIIFLSTFLSSDFTFSSCRRN